MKEEEIFDKIVPDNWVTSDEIIKVLGVGGGGCNAVDYMYNKGITGCTFAVCNSDRQALEGCSVPVKIRIGPGLGCGTDPKKACQYALEGKEQIEKIALDNHTKMLFITAGMGGGTGTGAAPVIARMAKDKGILTVAVVTLPFLNEGNEALTRAIDGVHALEQNVDSLLIINNEKLHEHYGSFLIRDALSMADEVLATAVRGIVDIVMKRGYINMDFMDVKTMMKDSGLALMGYGEGSGKNRVEDAVRAAFESPLLNDFDLKTARKVLVNITCSSGEQGLTMDDLGRINMLIDEYTGRSNNFKRGLRWDDGPEMGDTVRITSIVTGLRFADAIRPRDMGNYITITRSFIYDRSAAGHEDGFPLPEDTSFRSHDSVKKNALYFTWDSDKKPVLLLSEEASHAELENVPAIRRANSLSINTASYD